MQVPFAVELLAWDSVIDSGGGAPDPTLRGSGFGYLFEWTPTPQPQSVMPGPSGLPGLTAASGDHSHTLTADGTEKTLGVELTFRVRERVGAGPTATGSAATDVFGDAVADVWSDPAGRYLFTNLAPGDYRLGFDAPTGFGRTIAGAGAPDRDSDADPITGITGVVTVHGVVGGDVEASAGTFTYAFIDPTVDAGYERIVWDLGLAVDYDGIDLDASQITWQFAVDNAGPDAAPGPVVVTVELPEGLAFVSGGSTDVTCTAVEQTVTCIHADPMTANNEAVGVVPDGVIPPAPQPLPDVIAHTGLAIAPYAAGGLGLVLAGAAVWFLRRRGAQAARG